MSKKATIITYGCQMNVNETAKMKSLLESQGYEIIDDIYQSDAVFLNTCTIREGAAKRVYGKLGELKVIKRKRNGNFIIGVTGCLAQEAQQELIEKAPQVDIVLGNQNIAKIPFAIEKIENGSVEHILMVEDEDMLPQRLDAEFSDDIQASITIGYGCNNFCTYCIVPYVRGKERSVPMKEIIHDVNQYVTKGYKEILFLGQNVNSYGSDFSDFDENLRPTFAKLLKETVAVEGDFWVRYTSPHPKDFTEDVIEVIKTEPKVSRNIHLPLQAGSTKILDAMDRNYSKEQYLDLVERIRAEVSDVAFTTDIIVGFPGETEEDFLDTLDVVRKSRFENAYMFMYSPRKGTPAATMKDQVSEDVKKDRLQRLMRLQNEIAKEESLKYIGRTEKVLVEGPSRKNKEVLSGRTSSNKVVLFEGDYRKGQFVNVKINEAKTWTLYGDVVN